MTSSLSHQPNLVLSPFPDRTKTHAPFLHRVQYPTLSNPTKLLRGSSCVARLGFRPDPETVDGIRELLGRAEALIYTVADAAVSSSDAVTSTTSNSAKQSNDWLSGITNSLESILKVCVFFLDFGVLIDLWVLLGAFIGVG